MPESAPPSPRPSPAPPTSPATSAAHAAADRTPPLAGLRVVEIASNVSGPYAGKLLVDAGADVLKIEPPGGDPLRRWSASGTPLAEGEDGVLFQYLNASKRSVVVDLATEAGRRRVRALVSEADVLIEDLGPAGLEAVGLSPATLQADHPELTIVSLSDWGRDGPDARRPATEFTQQAAVGSIAYRGLRDRDPVAAGGRIGEWALGVFVAVGALTSHRLARRTGRGSHVDASRFEAMVLCMTVYHDLDGQWNEDPLPRSIEIPSIERARDGWVGFCTVTGQQWVDLCTLMGHPEVAEREEYFAAQKRMDDIDYMKELIEGWTLEQSVDEIVELCADMRIPASPIGNGETLPQMEHLVAREVFRTAPGGFLQPRPPYRIEHSAQRPTGPAPGLDADADAGFAPRPDRPAPTEPHARDARPLDGLKVVDLTAFWAGPMASCFLADMGADVIKIESAQRPDGMRFAGAIPNAEMWEWSPVFHGANPGKRDLTLNLDDARGLDLLKKLIADADVLIENYSARVLENFGLDWPTVHAMNPRLLMVRMPAFGLDGPWRDRSGFAMTVEQMSGLAWMTGYEDMPLVPRGTCDPIGGMHAIFTLLLALDELERDGRGRLVEVPLVEVAINIAAEQVLEHSAHGKLLGREENRSPLAAPQGLYPCAGHDETIALAVTDDAGWRALVELMGTPEWAKDTQLAHHAGRRAHADRIDEALRVWTRSQTADVLLALLHARGIAAERLVNARRLMPHAQLVHRRFFQTLTHPRTGETRYPGWPLAWSELPRALHRRPAPTLGEHNESILRDELGLSDEEIEALRTDQVIGERPTFM